MDNIKYMYVCLCVYLGTKEEGHKKIKGDGKHSLTFLFIIVVVLLFVGYQLLDLG